MKILELPADSREPNAGSDFYYAALYCPPGERSRLTIINQLRAEIASVPIKVSDRGIARIKLNWWHEESQRFAASTPQHHLTKAHTEIFGSDSELANALQALVSGLDDELNDQRFSTRDEQEQWFDATFGPIYACLRPQQLRTNVNAAACVAFGRSIEMAYALLQIRQFVERGIYRLPLSSLSSASTDWHTLEYHPGDAQLAELFTGEVDHIIAKLKATTSNSHRDLRALATWARIMLATLEEVRRDGYQVWRHRIELTPVRKLWIAWRTRWF